MVIAFAILGLALPALYGTFESSLSRTRHDARGTGHGVGDLARGRQSSTYCNCHPEAASSGDAVSGAQVRHCGFTLIEVLVSLSLMSLMATIMIASLQLGGHTWQRVTRRVADTNDVAQAQTLLRQWLASLHSYQHPRLQVTTPPVFLPTDLQTI